MKLRRLRIVGFKTFARRSEIEFDTGITAIVGPNGSGKSNVVDAIRWVLGETNARELRGARMDEVIYAGGGRARGRMGMAEVELVLDNEEGKIPIEGVEVAVGRRVVRGGDSDYRINGDRVRLRDMERVLGATGLTQSGYAVIAQNDVDGIIQASPSQRRYLIEQAAGVRSVRAAADDAVDRIARAEGVVRRLDDLLDDGEPRLAELASQAEMALEQRSLTERLAELRGSLAREEWRAARGQLKQAKRRWDQAENRLSAASEAEIAFARRFDEQRAIVDVARDALQNATDRAEAARLAAERAIGETRRWRDRQQSGVVARGHAITEVRITARDHDAATLALAEVDGTGGEIAASWEAMANRLGALSEQHEQSRTAVAEADATIAVAEEQLAVSGAEHAVAVEAARTLAARLTVLREARQELSGELAAVNSRLEELVEAQSSASRRVEAARISVAAAEADVARCSEGARAAAEAIDLADTAIAQLRDAAQAAVSRAAVLRGQIDGALGGSGPVAAAIAAGTITGVRMVEGIRARDPVDSAAIEAALEAHLGAWVVPDPGAALDLFDAQGAREEVLTAAMTVTNHRPDLAEGRWALDAVLVVRDEVSGALAFCLAGITLASDLSAAKRIVAAVGGTAVLPDGTAVNVAGVRGGGRPGQTLELAAEERSAASAAAAADVAVRSATADVVAARERRRLADDALADAGSSLQTARLELTEAAALAGSAETAAGSERHRAEVIDASRRVREAEEESSAGAMRDADEALRTITARTDDARARLDALRNAAAESRAREAAAALELRTAEAAAADLRAAASDMDRRRSLAADAVAVAAARRRGAELRALAAETDVLIASVRVAQAAAGGADAHEEVVFATAAVERYRPALAEADALLAAIEAERSEVAIALARANDESAAARVDVDAAQARVGELADTVREDGEDEGPEPDAQAAEKAEREIVRLERRISALGPVNGLAPEQHAALATRVGALRTDRDDLSSACADIRALALLLTEQAEKRFDSVFGAVAVHFAELFAELFPGGRATLRLEELAPELPQIGDEVDSTAPKRPKKLPGVEILAQPAGKRLQPLTLLSGGERALTALAVILALQQVTPSPFYIFDEVDAPLDDSNIGRFTRLLRRLSETQQFIVVTHNHATMAAADILYGVTIDDEGVSNIISVRLSGGGVVPEAELVGHRQPRVVTAAAS